MLLHQSVQRGLLGLVARAVDRGTIAMRPPGLVNVGLHSLGRRIWGGAASQGARAYASAFGGISYSRRHGDGPAAGYVSRGDLVVLTTATSRFLTELTADHLRIAHPLKFA